MKGRETDEGGAGRKTASGRNSTNWVELPGIGLNRALRSEFRPKFSWQNFCQPAWGSPLRVWDFEGFGGEAMMARGLL